MAGDVTRYRGDTGKNMPVYSLTAAVVLILGTLAALVFADIDEDSTPMFVAVTGLIVTTVPSLIAAAFAERTARDVRNGVVEEKVRKGAHRAMQEAGVVTREGPAMTLTMQALQQLLEQNTRVTQEGTAVAREALETVKERDGETS